MVAVRRTGLLYAGMFFLVLAVVAGQESLDGGGDVADSLVAVSTAGAGFLIAGAVLLAASFIVATLEETYSATSRLITQPANPPSGSGASASTTLPARGSGDPPVQTEPADSASMRPATSDQPSTASARPSWPS